MCDFMLCGNCVNWSQPWKLGKTVVVCKEATDSQGVPYTESHAVCDYFIPIQNTLPEEIQGFRLLVQALNVEQRSYLKWALRQAELLLGMTDAQHSPLALGDQVSFRRGLHGYTGTLEGLDPLNKKTNVIINCPAFADGTISLISTSVTKTDRQQAKELVRKCLTPRAEQSIKWNMDCLLHEITNMRAKRRNLSAAEYDALIAYEKDFKNLDTILQFNVTVKHILK